MSENIAGQIPLPALEQPAKNEPTAAQSDSADAGTTAETGPPKDHSRRKNPPPPGMSLSAYKRQLRKEKFEAEREEWLAKKKEKRKALKLEKKKQKAEGTLEQPTPHKHTPQVKSNVNVIVDCGFDEMMKEGEVKSLGQQLIRCYSENRKAPFTVDFAITSFNKTLLERFENNMKGQHLQWRNVAISNNDFVPPSDPSELANWVYFSSDSENTIETLEPHKTYIIGGIVDKGRYKNLCKDKAEKMGIQTGRLPIDEFVKISGRRVLTTNHVFEILLKWFEVKDWKIAFESVLPPRKLIGNKAGAKDGEHEDEQGEEEASEQKEEEPAEAAPSLTES